MYMMIINAPYIFFLSHGMYVEQNLSEFLVCRTQTYFLNIKKFRNLAYHVTVKWEVEQKLAGERGNF